MNEFDNGRCRAKESSNPNPFHIRPKAHVDEEEMSEDERRRFQMPRDIAEDNPVLEKLRSRKTEITEGESGTPPKGSLPKRPKGKHRCNETVMGE